MSEKTKNLVFIYRNLRSKTWSVRNNKRLVIGHPKQIILMDVTFKVSQAGRNRVLKEKRKSVHAGVQGVCLPKNSKKVISSFIDIVEVTYNPYLYSSFVRMDNKQSVTTAELVYMNEEMKVFAINPK